MNGSQYPSIVGSYAGGDYGLMDHFVSAVDEDDPHRIPSGPDESLESHLIVFAVERARHGQSVVTVDLT